MAIIVDSIISFFIDKGADYFFKGVNNLNQKRKSKQSIENFAIQYFDKHFFQIPLSQEFDFEGLNNFLYSNIDSLIAPCFNAPSHKERTFFNENLYKKSLRYAKDSRESKNTVQAYIQCILAIIENQFIERVDDKDWFLAGRVVDEVQESTGRLIKEYSTKLQEFFRYYGSFAESVDSVITQLNSDNQYHYLRKDIFFRGRKNDLEYLDNFLAAPESLLFAVITGQGGIGKSKLMHHYQLSEMGNQEWKIVFPSQNQIEMFTNQHTEWYYPKNLLVIIDYAGEIPEVVSKWINLLNNSHKRPVKMRIVMLERQGIVKGENENNLYPHWYMKIKQAAGHNFDSLLFEKQFYDLETLKQDDLFSLMDNIAENQKKIITLDEKKSILIHARDMGGERRTERFITPLIIILLTDALLCGENLGKLDSSRLMEYIISKHRQHWLKTICGENRDIFDSLEMLIVYATAIGGWDLTPLPEPFLKVSADFLNNYSRTNLSLILSDVTENTCQHYELSPLEPDIVGEYFVLWFLSENILKTSYNELLKLLWGETIYFCISVLLKLPFNK